MSRRKRFAASSADDLVELNLNSMIDLFAVLIPALLMMTAILEISVLHITVPRLNGASTNTSKPAKPPLHLTLRIDETGYQLTGEGLEPIALPVIQKDVVCARYRGTWPPPRVRNKTEAPCADGREKRLFWVYDAQALQAALKRIKTNFPEESQMILTASPAIEYESVIDAMDAARDLKIAQGLVIPLFADVMIRPPLGTL